MEEVEIIVARHEQQIHTLERDMSELKQIQAQIRLMNETLVTLATELKHTNEHIARQEIRIDEIDQLPKRRLQQIATAIISALAGGIISAVIGLLL